MANRNLMCVSGRTNTRNKTRTKKHPERSNKSPRSLADETVPNVKPVFVPVHGDNLQHTCDKGTQQSPICTQSLLLFGCRRSV